VYQAVAADGRVTCSVSGCLLTAQKEAVGIDIYSPDTAAMWQAIDAAIASGQTPVSSEEPYEALTGSAALGDEFDPGLSGGFIIGDAAAYTAYANMRVLDTFTFTFTLDTSVEADALAQAAELNAPIEDERVRVTFEEVRATPLSVAVRFTIVPVAGGWTNEEIADVYRSFACYGENREPVLVNRQVVATGSAGLAEQPDGTLIYQADLTLGPLAQTPARLLLVPYNQASSAQEPLWDYAIPIYLSWQ